MTIHSFFIFDRHCSCIYSREYSHTSATDAGQINKNNDSDSSKLLFGLLYSLKNISSKLNMSSADSANFLRSFSTANFRIHYYESLTNLKFILISDTDTDTLQTVLHELYANYYLNTVSMNFLSPVDFKEGERISNSSFITETDTYLRSLPLFQ